MAKVALVTGAARGIGLAIAQALLQAGYTVVGSDIDEVRLTQAAAEHGFTADAVDLTQPAAVAQLFGRIAEVHSGLDLLVNNAGTCFVTDFLAITPAELQQQMAINFESAFFCCQQAIPLMLLRPGIKKIVNISSNGAYNFDVFDPAHYRASKAALDNLTKHLARRYAHEGIVINSIAPAMTRTDLFDVVAPEVLAQALAGMPRREPLDPTEVAAWVAFLASPAGDCASGNVIILNQGRDVR
ncbi:MAG TPA: SDR family oxidoreductase [Roseiflexaceae bacterium]|nr:SDR family oxidoreductase [Roseiflexaceae bacterium]HMP41510.1 SDR family oxidoreductase [Roseiflexaceae bacterium]